MATKLYIESDEEVYIPIYTLKSYITDNYGKEFDPNCLL
jgi:hypothetical protein